MNSNRLIVRCKLKLHFGTRNLDNDEFNQIEIIPKIYMNDASFFCIAAI